jgi:hypothetical protein
MSFRAVRKGEPICMPVVERDGARTGFRTKPAPADGYYLEDGENSIFVHRDVVDAERLFFRGKRRR